MKLLQILMLALIFQGCGEIKSDAKTNEPFSDVAITDKLQNIENNSVVEIVSLNFEELETKYFQKETDTTYVINFWATWCKPCVEELPAFEKIASNYSDEKVKVLLVSLDFPTKIESQVIPFIKKNNITSEVVLLDDAAANSWIPKVSTAWSGAIPATVIYKKGNRNFYEQSFTFKELETELKTYL